MLSVYSPQRDLNYRMIKWFVKNEKDCMFGKIFLNMIRSLGVITWISKMRNLRDLGDYLYNSLEYFELQKIAIDKLVNTKDITIEMPIPKRNRYSKPHISYNHELNKKLSNI